MIYTFVNPDTGRTVSVDFRNVSAFFFSGWEKEGTSKCYIDFHGQNGEIILHLRECSKAFIEPLFDMWAKYQEVVNARQQATPPCPMPQRGSGHTQTHRTLLRHRRGL